MNHFSIFCVLLLQIILFARPTVSQLDQDRIRKAFADAGLIPNEGVSTFGYSLAQPVNRCSTIKYPLETITFLIDICFDTSSQELDAKLKAGDVDLGQAKGTFDGGVLISFNHGKHLNGHHRYYVKGTELWLRYSNRISGKDDNGDFKLRSLYFVSSEGSDAPKPEPKGNASKPLISSEDSGPPRPRPKDVVMPEPNEVPKPLISSDDSGPPRPRPKVDVKPEPNEVPKPLIFSEDSGPPRPRPKDDVKPGPNEEEPKPGPKEKVSKPLISSEDSGASNPGPKEEAKLGPKGDEPKPKAKGNANKPKAKGNANKPKPKGNANKPKAKGNANKPKAKGNANKLKPKGNANKPKPKGNASKPKPKAKAEL